MIPEDKSLLLKDLCARLPYGVKINIRSDYTNTLEDMELNVYHLDSLYSIEYRHLRPYLRSMSSMTEEEAIVYITLTHYNTDDEGKPYRELTVAAIDWLNSHHFDYRRLIGKGLALEAPEGMYKTE